MAKKRFTSEHQRFVVQGLACFLAPSEIRDGLKERWGIEASLSRIVYYDPTAAGTRLSQALRDLYDETRKRFIEETTDLAISHRTFRLRQLQSMATKLEAKASETKNPQLAKDLMKTAAEMYEQAAKEMGNLYSNRRELTGRDGGPIETKDLGLNLEDLTEGELAALAVQLAQRD